MKVLLRCRILNIPIVVLKTNIADVSADSLVDLAECDNIEHISLSYELEAMTDASDWDETLEGVALKD